MPKFGLSLSLAVALIFSGSVCSAQTHIARLENNPQQDINWMLDLENHKILDRSAYLDRLQKLRSKLEEQEKGKSDAKLQLQARIRLLAVYNALGLSAQANAVAIKLEKTPSEFGNYALQDYYRDNKAKLVKVLCSSMELAKHKPGGPPICAQLVRIGDLFYQLRDMVVAEKYYGQAYQIAVNGINHPAQPDGYPRSIEIGAFNAYACFLADRNRIAEARGLIEKAFEYCEDNSHYSLSCGYGGFDDFGAFMTIIERKDPALYAKLFKRWQTIVARNPRVGVLAKDGHEVTKPQFASISSFSEGSAVAQDLLTRRFGYIDKNGAWKLPPTFIDANPFSKGIATAVISHGVLPVDTAGQYVSFSLIDSEGKEIKNLGDSYATPFEGDIFVTSRTRHPRGCNVVSNIVDRSGEILYSGLIHGLWEKNGQHYSIFVPTFQTASGCEISAGGFMIAFSVVPDEARYGHYKLVQEDWDPTAKDKMQELSFDYIGQVLKERRSKEDSCRIGWDNNVVYLLDRSGKKISKDYYNIVRLEANCFKICEMSHGFGLIDATGAVIVPPKYEEIRVMSDGLAAFQMKQKWGFVNDKGQEVVPAKYDAVGDFHEGLTFYRR